jgi:hypothetical protein
MIRNDHALTTLTAVAGDSNKKGIATNVNKGLDNASYCLVEGVGSSAVGVVGSGGFKSGTKAQRRTHPRAGSASSEASGPEVASSLSPGVAAAISSHKQKMNDEDIISCLLVEMPDALEEHMAFAAKASQAVPAAVTAGAGYRSEQRPVITAAISAFQESDPSVGGSATWSGGTTLIAPLPSPKHAADCYVSSKEAKILFGSRTGGGDAVDKLSRQIMAHAAGFSHLNTPPSG